MSIVTPINPRLSKPSATEYLGKTFDSYTPPEDTRNEAHKHKIFARHIEPDQLSFEFSHFEDPYLGVAKCAQKYIAQFPLSSQIYLQELAQKVEYISFNEFRNQLHRSYMDVMSQLSNLYGYPFDITKEGIVLVEGRKSNKYVAEIALNFSKDLPSAYIRLGESQARSFVQFIESLDKDGLECFRNKSLILLDDGSYSGRQIGEHLSAIVKKALSINLPIKAIAIIIPYQTDFAHAHILNIAQSLNGKKKIPVLISTYQRIPVLSDLSTNTQQYLLKVVYKNSKTCDILRKIGLIWLQHKVPNAESFPDILARGRVLNEKGEDVVVQTRYSLLPQIISPYKREAPVESLPNFYPVTGFCKSFQSKQFKLYRGAQPYGDGCSELQKNYNIQTIFNLRNKPTATHRNTIHELGVKIVNIPVDWKNPNKEQVVEFLKRLYFSSAEGNAFVHCLRGSDRTGAFVACARMVFWGMTKEAAIAEMLQPQYGFQEITQQKLLKFLKDMDILALKEDVKQAILNA